jgi:hypothetical protein
MQILFLGKNFYPILMQVILGRRRYTGPQNMGQQETVQRTFLAT